MSAVSARDQQFKPLISQIVGDCNMTCFSSTVWPASLHLAFLPVRPDFPPLDHGDQKDFQAATGQSRLSREEPGLLLETEEAGEKGEG